MTYHDSLWKDAPEGASHYLVNEKVGGIFLQEIRKDWFTFWDAQEKRWSMAHLRERLLGDLHTKPTIYQSAAQLVDQYRKERGPEIEDQARFFMESNIAGNTPPLLDHLIDDAAFAMALLERYLAAERARVEGEQ